ncbi:MAG TPA: hypothetical protein VFB08_02870 [Burkholderiales bacterium]|nr:hypothetical protein [Burkholderiales bacterium]
MRRALVIAILCSGCSTLAEKPVPGWPALQVVEHRVPHEVMREHCVRYVGFGQSPAACAEFDFAQHRCDIWYSADFPPQPFIVEHERMHCRGYEHAGEHHLSEAWHRWQAAQESAVRP